MTSKQRLAWDDFAGFAPQSDRLEPEVEEPARPPPYKAPEVGFDLCCQGSSSDLCAEASERKLGISLTISRIEPV